jgi:asparaginyl-tRNA synthetase
MDSFFTRLESPLIAAVVDCQHQIHQETHSFWSKFGLKCMNFPITTASISSPMGLGSDSLPVQVNLFGVPTYLADSMQFALELGCRISSEGAYYIMPSFRGEATDETHLSQFFHSEVELPVNHATIMIKAEEYLKALVVRLLDSSHEKISKVQKNLTHLEALLSMDRFPCISVVDAFEILDRNEKYFKLVLGRVEITRAGEKALIDIFKGPVWLNGFAHFLVPFYQAFDPENKENALAADLLLGPGEILGCGQRHTSSLELIKALALHGVEAASYEWYLQMQHERPILTSGFGLGIERFLMWVLCVEDIRKLQILIRDRGSQIVP